jgi:hypothetical protein
MYKINKVQKEIADRLGLKIFPSVKKDKKLDVYKNEKYVTSIGAKGYDDYYSHLKNHDKVFADERRRLYLIRHKNNVGDAGMLAKRLLWND